MTTDSGTAAIDLETLSVKRVFAGTQARYLPTGDLIYHAGDEFVRVVPFDLQRLEVTGAEVPVLDNVFRGPGSGAAFFAVAPGSGTLVYVQGRFNRTLVLVDRNGRETAVPAAPRGYRFPGVSSDGRQVVVTVDPRPSDLWIIDLERGTGERQQTAGHDGWGVWAPDGKRVAFLLQGPQRVGWRAFPFVAEPVVVEIKATSPTYPKIWAPDDHILSNADGDIVSLSLRDGSVTPVVATAAVEQDPALSGDGRWLAFDSDASGTSEVYVQAYPLPRGRVMASAGGGVEPRWSASGSELYYRRGTAIMAVPVRATDRFEVQGPPVELFAGLYDFTQNGNWTVGPNGHFLMIKGDPTTTTRFQVVVNWLDERRANRSR